MRCLRLQKLIKNWYLQVQDEAMAPARMVAFMEKHLLDCEICRADPDVRPEVQKITNLLLPPAKAKPAPDAGGEEDEARDKDGDESSEVEETERGDEGDEEKGDDPDLVDDEENMLDDDDEI